MQPPSTPPKAPPPSNRSAPAAATSKPAPMLAVPTARMEPPRIVLNATEGWGKTSFGAYAPDPAILMARGETGYLTLLGHQRAPAVPAVTIDSWDALLAAVDSLIADPQGRKTLVLDAAGGFERLCHEHVCKRDFKGDFSEGGFMSFHKGYHQSVGDWLQLLQRLDRLRDAHGMTIVLLSHSMVKSFKNPMGDDFDRYIADMHEKTWGATHKWADAVLFGNFYTVTEKSKNARSVKGVGGTDRVLYAERRDAFDAKNRYGLPNMMTMPDDAASVWSTIWNAIAGA